MMGRRHVVEYIKTARRYLKDGEDTQKLDDLVLLIEDHMAYSLFDEIEKTKISLSDSSHVLLKFEYDHIDVKEEVFSSDFKRFSFEHTEKIMACLDGCLKDAGIQASDVDIVCMTGGTSKLPFVVDALKQRFGERLTTSSQFDSVVQGLAVRAAQDC
jgi:hypothetical chaperone protein